MKITFIENRSPARATNPGSAGASPAVSCASRDTLPTLRSASSEATPVPKPFFGEAPKIAGGAPALPGKRRSVHYFA